MPKVAPKFSQFTDAELALPFRVEFDDRTAPYSSRIGAWFATREAAEQYYRLDLAKNKWMGEIGDYKHKELGSVRDLIWFKWSTTKAWPERPHPQENHKGYPDQNVFQLVEYKPVPRSVGNGAS